MQACWCRIRAGFLTCPLPIFGARALEGVAADDRAVAAAIANVARVLIDRIGPLGSATRKHDDAAAIEARLNDMADAIRLFGPVGALIRLLRVLLLDMRARQLDLDDVCAEQRRHVRGIGADIEREFAVLAQLAAARIRPDHRDRKRTSLNSS